MLDSIKKFMNWPTTGISNLSELSAYAKANWLSLSIVVILIIIAFWLIKKVFSFVATIFNG